MLKIKTLVLALLMASMLSQLSFARSHWNNNTPFEVRFRYKYWYLVTSKWQKGFDVAPFSSAVKGAGNANIINGACAFYKPPGIDEWKRIARAGINPRNPPGGRYNCYGSKMSNPQRFEVNTITDTETGEIYPIFTGR